MANDPMAVVQALNDTCNSGDVEGVLDLFTDDAVVKNQPPPSPADSGVYTGKQEIRGWFEPQIQRHLHVESRNYRVSGDTVTWRTVVTEDELRQMGIDDFEVTAEATVQNGKITSFTVTPTPETLSKVQAAMAQGGAG